MADEIKEIVREDKSDASLHCWHVSYEVEDGGAKNSFVVVVLPEEMTTESSEAEAKTLANAKATTIKADWVTAKATASTNTTTTDTPESVTL